MFDSYEPSTTLNCSTCQVSLNGWQGKDGPNELLLWKQGHPTPVGFLTVDDQFIAFDSADAGDNDRLPAVFKFYTHCEGCNSRITAVGKCINGTWTSSEVASVERLKDMF